MATGSSQSTTANYPINAPFELPWSQKLSNRKRFHRVVLSGGPCGGKSSAQAHLATFFRSLGWKVMVVPETATIIYNGAIKKDEMCPQQRYNFQRDLLSTMISLENVYFNLAKHITDQDVLVICDRGFMDPSSYCSKEVWKSILEELHLNEFDFKNKRYDQIIHMTTAAGGAAEHYSLANNMARRETLEQAIEQDTNTKFAWSGHQCVDVIQNFDNFKDKLDKTIQVVCDRIGIHLNNPIAPVLTKKTLKLKNFDEEKVKRLLKTEEFEVKEFAVISEQDDQNKHQILTTVKDGSFFHTLTSEYFVKEINNYVEIQRNISEEEFNLYSKTKAVYSIKRYNFIFDNHSFNLDILVFPHSEATQSVFLETFTTIDPHLSIPQHFLPDFLWVETAIVNKKDFLLALSKQIFQNYAATKNIAI